MQNLKTLADGKDDYELVKAALIKMTIAGGKLLSKSKDSFFEGTEQPTRVGAASSSLHSLPWQDSNQPPDESDSDLESLDSDGERLVLAEIEKLDVVEDGLQPIFAVIDSVKADRKKTWAENRLLKKAIAKDRGHFEKMVEPIPLGLRGCREENGQEKTREKGSASIN